MLFSSASVITNNSIFSSEIEVKKYELTTWKNVFSMGKGNIAQCIFSFFLKTPHITDPKFIEGTCEWWCFFPQTLFSVTGEIWMTRAFWEKKKPCLPYVRDIHHGLSRSDPGTLLGQDPGNVPRGASRLACFKSVTGQYHINN